MTVRIGWCRLLFKRRLLLKKSWRFFKKTTLLLEGRGHTLLQRPFRITPRLERPEASTEVITPRPKRRRCPARRREKTRKTTLFRPTLVTFLAQTARNSQTFRIFSANSGNTGILARHRCGRGRPRSQPQMRARAPAFPGKQRR